MTEVCRSKQETVNDLTSQLSEQTSLGEMLSICERVVCIVARVNHRKFCSADKVRIIK